MKDECFWPLICFFFYPLDVEHQPARSNNNSIDSCFVYIWKVVHIQKTKLTMVITNQASLTFYSSYSCEEGWFLWWWWWLIWHLVPLESCWFQTTVEPPLMSNSPQWPLLYSGYIPIGIFNPAILTKIFPSSQNPKSFYRNLSQSW